MRYTFDEFKNDLEHFTNGKEDYLAEPKHHTTVDGNGNLVMQHDRHGAQEFRFSQHGLRSYLARFGLKESVWEKLNPDTKRLVNGDLTQKFEKPLLFRTFENKVRFAGSDAYEVYDNKSAAEQILPLFDRIKFRGGNVDPDHMNIRATYGEPIGKMANHEFYLGIHISNNEVGEGMFHGSLMVFDEVCRNGLIFARYPLFHRSIIHLKNRNEDRSIDFDHITCEFEKSRDLVAERLDKAQELRLNLGDTTKAEEFLKLGIRAGLTKKFLEPILYGERATLDVISDITRRSQNLERAARIRADVFAGQLLLNAA